MQRIISHSKNCRCDYCETIEAAKKMSLELEKKDLTKFDAWRGLINFYNELEHHLMYAFSNLTPFTLVFRIEINCTFRPYSYVSDIFDDRSVLSSYGVSASYS